MKLTFTETRFAGLLSFSSVKTQCITRLLSFLGHTFPKIRKTAAEQFYLQLEVNEELVDASKVEEVKEILLTTQWYVDLKEKNEKNANTFIKINRRNCILIDYCSGLRKQS
jgi:7-cyano-7-deazaguanine synthase in queuosine biosynthesis